MAVLWILLGFLIFLLLLLVGLLFCPMQFGVRYEKTADAEKMHIYVSVFGILIRIPIHTKDEKRDKKQIAKSKEVPEKKPLTYDSFKETVSELQAFYDTAKAELKDMLSYFRQHLSCKEVDFVIRFGLDDAAKTGIATGAVWTSGTLLLRMVDSLIGIKKINMNVYPDFCQKKFEIYVKTILIIQPFRFIIMIRKLKQTIKFIQNKIKHK